MAIRICFVTISVCLIFLSYEVFQEPSKKLLLFRYYTRLILLMIILITSRSNVLRYSTTRTIVRHLRVILQIGLENRGSTHRPTADTWYDTRRSAPTATIVPRRWAAHGDVLRRAHIRLVHYDDQILHTVFINARVLVESN